MTDVVAWPLQTVLSPREIVPVVIRVRLFHESD